MQQIITIELLREFLEYDPSSGTLTWKCRDSRHFRASPKRTADHAAANWNARYAGKPALTCFNGGYLTGRIFDRPMKAHRVAWAIVHGSWPEAHIDHINGDRADNRIVNLRVVSDAENRRNVKLYRTNKSGVHGITWDRSRGKWQVHCLRKSVGRFETLDAAIAARRQAEKAGGFHPNHGRRF